MPVQLVINIKHIWIALRSNLNLCPDKFHTLCQETKQIYKAAVPWNEMNSAQHKVLDHAFLVIRALPNGLFVGQSSEECSEANNKVLKKDEVEHSRQDSHINRITDIVMRQIDRSHPVTLDNLMKRRVTGKRKTRKARLERNDSQCWDAASEDKASNRDNSSSRAGPVELSMTFNARTLHRMSQ